MSKKAPKTTKAERAAQMKKWREENPELARKHGRKAQAAYAKRHPKRVMLKAAKLRARKKGLPFDITEHDFEIPAKCPALGIPLVRADGPGFSPNSPSIDRIRPELGYVPGNVAVISNQANRIKCDATVDELAKITRWLRKELSG